MKEVLVKPFGPYHFLNYHRRVLLMHPAVKYELMDDWSIHPTMRSYSSIISTKVRPKSEALCAISKLDDCLQSAISLNADLIKAFLSGVDEKQSFTIIADHPQFKDIIPFTTTLSWSNIRCGLVLPVYGFDDDWGDLISHFPRKKYCFAESLDDIFVFKDLRKPRSFMVVYGMPSTGKTTAIEKLSKHVQCHDTDIIGVEHFGLTPPFSALHAMQIADYILDSISSGIIFTNLKLPIQNFRPSFCFSRPNDDIVAMLTQRKADPGIINDVPNWAPAYKSLQLDKDQYISDYADLILNTYNQRAHSPN